MRATFESAIAANRFGLGARPGELASIAADPRAWLLAQLDGRPPATLADAGLASSQQLVSEWLEWRRERQQARASPNVADVVRFFAERARPVYVAEATARLRFAVSTERGFLERLTQFWTNHFAVSVDKQIVLPLAGSFEREAIRPYVLGNFTDLLLAAERHPAMLLYLDNYLSVGPHAPLARLARLRPAARVGINENLAREILELHTLGVQGGYTQMDVTRFAYVLSGWSIGGGTGRLARGEPGRFFFRAGLHEPGAQELLGKRYAGTGIEQGEAVLGDLARHPATARHVAMKLARHFIADDPPPSAVERIARAFRDSGGALPVVYRAVIACPEGWEQPLTKYKTPADYAVSVYRGLHLPAPEGRDALAPLELLGQRTYSPGSPAGWPDRAADWDGATPLLRRIEWVDAIGAHVGERYEATELAGELLGATLGAHTRTALTQAASRPQALTLLLASPEFLRR